MDSKAIIKFLKISCSLVFFGRAYQHLFWDAPFRSLFWDQSLLEPLVTKVFDLSWEAYATSMSTDAALQSLIRGHGILYLICGIIALLIHAQSKKWMRYTLYVGGISLVLLAVLQTKSRFYHFTMFFEHAIQFGVPFLLIWYLKTKDTKKLILALKILIALTFSCHGIYALGTIFPLPASFVTMTLNLLPVTEETAVQLLMLAAVLDFLIALLIFIPKLAKPVLLYAAFWGFTTAFARIANGFSYDVSLSIVHQYLYTTVFRIPHAIIPLLLYYMLKKTKRWQAPNDSIK